MSEHYSILEYHRTTVWDGEPGEILRADPTDPTRPPRRAYTGTADAVLAVLVADIADLWTRDIDQYRADGEDELADELADDLPGVLDRAREVVRASVAAGKPTDELALDPEPYYWAVVVPAKHDPFECDTMLVSQSIESEE